MATSVAAIKVEQHANPAESIVSGLTRELRQRGNRNPGSICVSPSSSESSSRSNLLEQLQAAITPILTRDDARRELNSQTGEIADKDCLSRRLPGQSSLPNARCTTPPPVLRSARTISGPAGIVKKRTRKSKKPPTQIVETDSMQFRETVQRLTGGTFCSQTSGTASTIVSTASVTRNSVDVLRSQNSRRNACLDSVRSPAMEVPAVAPSIVSAGTSSVSQEPPELPALLFQGSEDAGSLNDMMGYTNQLQYSWLTMESTFSSSESVDVSSSSQFAAVYPSKIIRSSSYSMPCLHSEETDLSNEGGGPYYQREVPSSAAECLKGAGSGDILRHFHPEEESDIDSWINSDNNPALKNVYINSIH